MSNVISLFPVSAPVTTVSAPVTAKVDYSSIRAEAAQNGLNTPNWNVPTCKASDIGKSLHQQFEEKGVFYEVDGRDNFVRADNGEFISTGKKTIFNATSQKALGVMSQGYKIAQNREIFEAALREIDNAGIDTKNAFTRVSMDNDGQRVMAEIIFPETSFEVTVGDTVALSISVINSFDGSGAFTIKMGAFRFVCANGMASAQNIVAYNSSHTAKLDVGFAAKTIVCGMEQYLSDKESMLEQVRTPVNEQIAYETIALMSGIDITEVKTYAQYTAEIRPTLKRQPAIERHMDLWSKYKKELGLNQWALHNVLTHVSTHGDKVEYSASNKITTRATKEKLASAALVHMLSKAA